MIDLSKVTDAIGKKVGVGVGYTKDPTTGVTTGAEGHALGSDVRVRDVSPTQTDTDVSTTHLLPVGADVGFHSDKETKDVTGGHVGGWLGTKGAKGTADLDVNNCTATVSGSLGGPLGTVASGSVSVPLPFCDDTPPTPPVVLPPNKSSDVYTPLPDSSGCEEMTLIVDILELNETAYDGFRLMTQDIGTATSHDTLTWQVDSVEFPCEKGVKVQRQKLAASAAYFYTVEYDAIIKVTSRRKVVYVENRHSTGIQFDIGQPTRPGTSPSTVQPDPDGTVIYTYNSDNDPTFVSHFEEYVALEDFSDYKYELTCCTLWLGDYQYLKAKFSPTYFRSSASSGFYYKSDGADAYGDSSPEPINIPSLIGHARKVGWEEVGYGFYGKAWTTVLSQTFVTYLSYYKRTYKVLCGNWDNRDKHNKKPPYDRNNMSDCCSASLRQNRDLKDKQDKQDDDLEQLKKQVGEIYAVLNPPELTDGKTSVPKSLLYPGASGQENITNYIDLLIALLRQNDKANGFWPCEVKVADSDPTKGANKELKIQVQSQADALKLIIQHLIQTEGDADTSLNFDVRTAYTLVVLQKEIATIMQTVRNIEDYLGYSVKHESLSIPCVFNPFVDLRNGKNWLPFSQAYIDDLSKKSLEDVIPELLKEKEVDIKITSLDEKKFLNESLLELLRGIQACTASLTHEYKGTENLRRFLDDAVATRQLGAFLNREDIRSVLEVGDLTNFENDVQAGYAATAQTADINVKSKPYNKGFEKRPKLKKVSRRSKKGKANG